MFYTQKSKSVFFPVSFFCPWPNVRNKSYTMLIKMLCSTSPLRTTDKLSNKIYIYTSMGDVERQMPQCKVPDRRSDGVRSLVPSTKNRVFASRLRAIGRTPATPYECGVISHYIFFFLAFFAFVSLVPSFAVLRFSMGQRRKKKRRKQTKNIEGNARNGYIKIIDIARLLFNVPSVFE